MKQKSKGVYIHIPFCESKCFYCDFVSYPHKEEYYKHYTDTLIKEINNCEELHHINIGSIFIGGGTPTVLPPIFLCQILETLWKFNLDSDAEITIEANPGTLKSETLYMLKNSGANRISMGLQAWQNSLLKKIGRIHSRELFLENFNEAMRIGFSNINVDLMFSLPGQTIEQLCETLENIVRLSPAHISVYSLIVEENTRFGKMLAAGEYSLPDEELDREMYHMTQKFLKAQGYIHYEISNFSKPDFQCRHNVLYWERGEYLGFGAGAHSFSNGIRYSNTPELQKYLSADGRRELIKCDEVKLSETDAMEEFVFLGLRMMKGISISEFKKIFGIDIFDLYGGKINKLLKNNFLDRDGDRIFLTLRGIDVSNLVFGEFLL